MHGSDRRARTVVRQARRYIPLANSGELIGKGKIRLKKRIVPHRVEVFADVVL